VPERKRPTGVPPPFDWQKIFAEAGLVDMQETNEFLPGWVPPLFVETRVAWRGKYAECPDLPVRAEAGMREGRLVFFHVAPEHNLTRQMQLHALSGRKNMNSDARATMIAVINVAIWTIGVSLAWHNLRHGRANLRGAALLAGFYFAAFELGCMFSAHHVPQFWAEQEMLNANLGDGLNLALFIFVVYLAMEPFVRRRWPWRVVAWNRLLAGRWRDPLVGRDVLVGAAAGTVVALLSQLTVLVPIWLGRPPEDPDWIYNPMLTGGPVHGLATIFTVSVLPTLGGFFMIFLFFLVTRRVWLAAVVYSAVWMIPAWLAPIENRDVILPIMLAYGVIIILVYLQAGLLAVAALHVTLLISAWAPVTFEFSAWYSGSSIVYLAVFVGLVLYGFVVASGGQALAWVGYLTGEPGAELEPAMD
jgi:serine/threonine-protein kinase